MSETIKIKYHADIEHIRPVPGGDWLDLRVAEDVFIKQGEYKQIYIATCVIITDRITHTSHNYCIYDRVPLDSLPEFKGLQELKVSECVMYLEDKNTFIHVKCFVTTSAMELMEMVYGWFKNESLSEKIDWRYLHDEW